MEEGSSTSVPINTFPLVLTLKKVVLVSKSLIFQLASPFINQLKVAFIVINNYFRDKINFVRENLFQIVTFRDKNVYKEINHFNKDLP